MELNSFNKFGHVEQSVKIDQGQQLTLVLRKGVMMKDEKVSLIQWVDIYLSMFDGA